MCCAKALTCHAVQGNTLPKTNIHLSTDMTLALLYVAFWRVSYLEDIIVVGNLDIFEKVKPWKQELLDEEKRLETIQKKTLSSILHSYPYLNDIVLKEEAGL